MLVSFFKIKAGYLKSKHYEHYEVSSYAYRGEEEEDNDDRVISSSSSRRSRHNQIYWAPSSSWYAIGLGATSFVNKRLKARPKTLVDYYKWVEDQEQQQQREDDDEIIMSDQELLTELVMKRLRTSDGLDLKLVREDFGNDIVSSILQGTKLGLELGMAEYNDRDEILRLKDPDGLLYSNYIISSIFAELE